MNIHPTTDRLLIKVIADQNTQLANGLFKPQSADDVLIKATVLEAGPGILMDNGGLHPLPYHVGHNILIDKEAGIKLNQFLGEDIRLVVWTEVLATYHD